MLSDAFRTRRLVRDGVNFRAPPSSAQSLRAQLGLSDLREATDLH
jgi:hypothetical protein